MALALRASHPEDAQCTAGQTKSLHRALGLGSLWEWAPNYCSIFHRNLCLVYSPLKKSEKDITLKRAGPGS